ncbi:hypothetical protein [Arthrobacter sp. NPDC090010]|uniref:hypothetical protein n=1 Tax=Arthrobacter sp. NPDC090010 TaxID=3363942 RepID=UPI00381DC804
MNNQERRARAAAEAIRAALNEGITFTQHDDFATPIATAALAAADTVDELRQSGHVLELSKAGWTIQHPAACRPNLLDCVVNRRIQEIPHAQFGPRQFAEGRYIAEVTDGILRIAPLPVSPDCRAGNHHKCDFRARDLINDIVRDCACTCHDPAGAVAA